MEFLNIEYLILLIIPVVLTLLSLKSGESFERYFSKEMLELMLKGSTGMRKRTRVILLNLSLILGIVALARPVIDRGEIKVKEEFRDIVVAFDLSKSMFVSDLYPNRFEFSKKKFFNLLDEMKDSRFGVVAFTSRAFIVSPVTSDFQTLKHLVRDLSDRYIYTNGTDIMKPLEMTTKLIRKERDRVLLIFTDGGDKSDYSEEIEYAKKNNISVYILGVATRKGGVVKDRGQPVRDSNGNIVISRLNTAIASLAKETGGAFIEYTLNSSDIKLLANEIKSKFDLKGSKSLTIKDRKELFYYPLALAILIFIVATSSLPRREN
jgi:Ca-activated chloride channel family protein